MPPDPHETGPRPEPPPEGPLGAGGDAGHLRVPIRIEEALAAAAMALICVISFANVVVRYVTNISFAFTEEFSIFLLVFMTFVGASFAFAVGGHIRIAFLAERFGPTGRRICEAVALAASFAMFALVFWYGATLTYDEWRFEETSPGLGYPTWIYTIWMPLLSIAILLRLLGRAVAMVRGRR